MLLYFIVWVLNFIRFLSSSLSLVWRLTVHLLLLLLFLTVTKIKQERTKICPFFDFLLHFSVFLLEILNKAPQLNCEAILKILNKNIDKCRR